MDKQDSSTNTVTLFVTKKSRIITDTSPWIQLIVNKNIPLYQEDVQWNYLQEAAKTMNSTNSTNSTLDNGSGAFLVQQQIKRKIQGYKAQDMEKQLWDATQFVHYEYVLQLLVQCHLTCVYCRKPTMVLYKYVREPKQWTLERMDNSLGHICGNVQIACLTCNLRRRTMKQERYLLTKQMMRVIKLPEVQEESI
jgi:hypothetical protein